MFTAFDRTISAAELEGLVFFQPSRVLVGQPHSQGEGRNGLFVMNNPISWVDPLGLKWILNDNPYSTRNTVITDGRGNLVPVLNGQGKQNSNVEKAMTVHENSHIEDAVSENPKIADGQPRGRQLANTSAVDLYKSEVRAARAEIDYLNNIIKNPELSKKDFDAINKRLDEETRYLHDNEKALDKAIQGGNVNDINDVDDTDHSRL